MSAATASNLPVVALSGLSHSYGGRAALEQLSLTVTRGELFAVLGPNGGGKTTLFRILSTLIRPQTGDVKVLDYSLPAQASEVRRRLGVVFQAPSVDRKLTVVENLACHAALYGLVGKAYLARRDELLARFQLTDRAHELVERLSGGLRRRVELAKALLPSPELLLLDEPSTGLDPAARAELLRCLQEMTASGQATVIWTTHYLDEAAKAGRVAILDHGKLVALDTPDALCQAVGGDTIAVDVPDPEQAAAVLKAKLGLSAHVVERQVRCEAAEGHVWIARIVEALPGQVRSVRVGRPTLEDVFIERTGHSFWTDAEERAA
jgi:ABC-2 type transport system ATP-binding protein